MTRLFNIASKPFQAAISFFMKFDDLSSTDLFLYKLCYSAILMMVSILPIFASYIYFHTMPVVVAWTLLLLSALFLALGWGNVMEPWINNEPSKE